ncbi:hypothetical protein AALP_AAs47338U000100, partial [Arabis alpina]
MPKLEEADINVDRDLEKLHESISSVKRLLLRAFYNSEAEYVYRSGIVFNKLEHLKLCKSNDNWSKLLVRLLKDSPKLRVLNLCVDDCPHEEEYESASWNNKQSSELPVYLLISELKSSLVDLFLVTPSLKYFKVVDEREMFSYLIEPMPKLEEADIDVLQNLKKLLESITSVKRLSLRALYNRQREPVYRSGIVFNQLEHLKLCICNDYWSKLLVRLLQDSPKLRVLNLYLDDDLRFEDYERIMWRKKLSSVPKCLLTSLETFEFAG